MYENLSHISDGVAVDVRRLALGLAQAELLEWETVHEILDKKPEELAPLVGSIATLFIESVGHDADAGRVPDDPAVYRSEKMRPNNAAAVLEEFESRYRAARTACPEDFPLSSQAKRFLTSLLKPTSSDFWSRLDLNGQQAEVFGDTMIVDHNNLKKNATKGVAAQAMSIQLYLAGHSDEQILEATGMASIQSIRQFRTRFKDLLLEKYADGRDTARRRFGRCLSMDQLTVLKAEFPDAFKPEP